MGTKNDEPHIQQMFELTIEIVLLGYYWCYLLIFPSVSRAFLSSGIEKICLWRLNKNKTRNKVTKQDKTRQKQ